MIKNLIFDLGGVILNIDFQLTISAFHKMGIQNINELFSAYSQNEFFNDFDKGLINPDEFRKEIRKRLSDNFSDEQIDEAWNAMLLDFPTQNINFLLSVKSKYRTFLLSNTNAIHFPIYNKQLNDKYHIPHLSLLFEKAYYSYLEGLRKPDIEIFEKVLLENKLMPEETLFIDDSTHNTATAEKLGINTITLESPKTLTEMVIRKIF